MRDLITEITTKKYDDYKMYELFYTAFTNDKSAVVEHIEILKGSVNTSILSTIYYCTEAANKIESKEIDKLKKDIDVLEMVVNSRDFIISKLKNRSLIQRILNK